MKPRQGIVCIIMLSALSFTVADDEWCDGVGAWSAWSPAQGSTDCGVCRDSSRSRKLGHCEPGGSQACTEKEALIKEIYMYQAIGATFSETIQCLDGMGLGGCVAAAGGCAGCWKSGLPTTGPGLALCIISCVGASAACVCEIANCSIKECELYGIDASNTAIGCE